MIRLYDEELLAPRPTAKLGDHPLSTLLTSVLANAVFLFYSGLSSSYFEFNYFLYDFFLFLLIVLFRHPIFLNYFSYFVSLLFLNFHNLLILVLRKMIKNPL